MEILSYAQLDFLVNNPFHENSPFIINKLDESTLLKVPILQEILYLIEIVKRENSIQLTKNGNLPVKVVKELYEKGPLKNEWIEKDIDKLYGEESCEEIHYTHLLCKLNSFFLKRNNRIQITRKTEELLLDKNELLKRIIESMFMKFNTAYFDGFQNETIGQIGIVYSLYLLSKYGNEIRPITFYSQKYREIFPDFINEIEETQFRDRETVFDGCYSIRTFNRCLKYLGILKIINKDVIKIEAVKTNDLFDKLFKFEIEYQSFNLN